MQFRLVLFLACVVALLVGCDGAPTTAPPAPVRPVQQLPTATEVFHLRGECAKLADKIREGNTIGSALAQEASSRYDAKANRCRVELWVHSSDLNAMPYHHSRTIFDGQTGAILANVGDVNGRESAFAIGKPGVNTYEQVNTYINEMMKDD